MLLSRFVLACCLVAMAPIVATAEVFEPEIIPSFGEGFATNAELQQFVGPQRYQLENCEMGDKYDDDVRDVRIDLAKSDFEHGRVIDALLRKGAQFAWRECPRPYYNIVWDTLTGDFYYDVRTVQIYLPDGTLAVEGKLGKFHYSDGVTAPSNKYEWAFVRNVYRETLDANAQAERDAIARQQHAERRAQQEQRNGDAEAAFWGWVRLLLAGALTLGAFLKRERLLYWFYSLTPHPASSMVHQAIVARTELDGAAFGRAVVSDSDNNIERQVRMDQTHRLTDLWRAHERTLNAEEAALVARANHQTEQERVRLEAEEALLRAAIEHEKAAARVEALRKREQPS